MIETYILKVDTPEECKAKIVEWLLQQAMKAAVDINVDNTFKRRVQSDTYSEAASFISRIEIER